MKHAREDIVHGSKGDALRGTRILITGDGPVSALLRMLFLKAGYSDMTWVIDDVAVTDGHVKSDPMLKTVDVGSGYVQALRGRVPNLSTCPDPDIRILDREQAKETDLTTFRMALTGDSLLTNDVIRPGEDVPWILGQAGRNGFRVHLMPDGRETGHRCNIGTSSMNPGEPTFSMMAASHMMAICQEWQRGTTGETGPPATCEFTGLFRFRDGGDSDRESRTHATSSRIGFEPAEKRLAVVGCGALGSHVALVLARQGFKRVTLVDFDETREHNLSRLALMENSDVGVRKCVALSKRIRERHGFEYACVETEAEALPERELTSMDLVLCCADRHTARRHLAGIARINGTPLVQGGFGGDLFQITTGTEIDALFTMADSPKNSCTGLSIDKDGPAPVGATQATVGLTAAVMVEAAVRMLNGDEEIMNGFHTWRFPNVSHRLNLPKRIDSPGNRKEGIELQWDATLARLAEAVHAVFPGCHLRIDHPFVIDWDCPVCRKTIPVRRHLHLLSDEDRFHPECLRENEHLKHMNLPRRWTLLEDRIGLDSDADILSRTLAESGLQDGSIIPVCMAGTAIGHVEISLTGREGRNGRGLTLTDAVVSAMRKHALEVFERIGHEAAGLLFGTVSGDGSVCIDETVPAEVESSSPAYVEMSGRWLARILYESEGRKTVCGWWHSHPRMGLGPSARDLRTFEQFPLGSQYSLIIDPTCRETGMAAYQWRAGRAEACAFRVLTEGADGVNDK